MSPSGTVPTSRGLLCLYWPGRSVRQVNEDRCTWREKGRGKERKTERVREGERRRRKGRERGGERERERKKENDCTREEEKETRGGRSSSFLFLRLDAIDLSFSPPRLLDFSVSSPSREPFRRTYVCPSVRLSFLDYLLFLTDVSCLLHYRRSECVSSSSPRRRLTSLLRSSLHRGCVGPSRALPPFAPYRSFCVQHPRSEHSAETLNDFLPPRHTSAPPRDGSNARSVRAGTTLTDVVSPAGSRFSPSFSCSSSSTSSSVSLPSLVHFFSSPRCFYCDEYL